MEKAKIENLNFILAECNPINLKGTLKTFNGQFEGFSVPRRSQM